MALSKTSVANAALQLAKAKARVVNVDSDTSDNAIKVRNIWEYIEREVLEAVKPKFATVRVALAKNATAPIYGWDYAYALPAEFVCFGDDKENDPVVYVPTVSTSFVDVSGTVYGAPSAEYLKYNSRNYPYVIEDMGDDNNYLLSNWDSETDGGEIYIRYVKYGVNVSKWFAMFATAFIHRLASDLALTISEDTKRCDWLMQRYGVFQRQAIVVNRQLDYVDDMGHNDVINVRGR